MFGPVSSNLKDSNPPLINHLDSQKCRDTEISVILTFMVCPFLQNEFCQLSEPLDELNDDALSDGGEEEMSIEQQGLPEANMLASVHAEYAQAQMNDGLEQVRLVIGNEVTSELSDDSIKDALWEYYFDIERTVQWALGL
jgi:hypothetical protein